MRQRSTGGGGAAEPLGVRGHDLLVALRLVVVADEVQKPVCEKHAHFGVERPALLLRLAARRLHAHHDVAEHLRRIPRFLGPSSARARRRRCAHRLPLAHREREHVRGAVAMTEDTVELADLLDRR